jgi:hypothetical protein
VALELALLYATLATLEALLILGYGTLARLRVPFVEGAAFVVAGAIWFSAGPLL